MSDETPDDLNDDASGVDDQHATEADGVHETDGVIEADGVDEAEGVDEADGVIEAEGVDEADGFAAVATQLDPADDTWWRSAIFYQIYPRSFSDLDGDGIGDLAGVIDKLGYLELLGVDALWLSPIMRSPMADHGYDVSDPRDIDPLFGDLATFDELIAEAHDREIRVTMDLVPNHTSDQHQWFIDALAAGPGSPERARYIFRDGRGENGDEPPNNWVSIFGGPAWDRVTEADGTPGQWYLHIFAREQPDLNWENPEVFDDLEKTLRFWLDRGVDGFRIDVAHGMAKPADLPDMDVEAAGLLVNRDDDPRFNNYAVHDIHRKIRAVIDDYPGAANVGEIWVDDNERFAEYLRPDELHLGFNFRLAKAPFDADSIRDAIENSLDAVQSVGGTPTWTLSNHDVDREVTRYGSAVVTSDSETSDSETPDTETQDTETSAGETLDDATPDAETPDAETSVSETLDDETPDTETQDSGTEDTETEGAEQTPHVDVELGTARARAMALVEFALPGSIFIYNGAELGLPNADLPDDALQDPVWERSGHTERGRDASRVPLPWEGSEPPFGFSTNPQTWLPIPESWAEYTVEAELEDMNSTLSLYRTAIELRYERDEFAGDGIEWYGAPTGCLAFRRSEGHLVCALNTTSEPVGLPPGDLILTSAPLVDGMLAPNAAAWLV